jgi:hypothetical protein
MAEEVQLLRLVRAFAKITDPIRRREIIALVEAAAEKKGEPKPAA